MKSQRMKSLLLAIMLAASASSAFAFNPDEVLKDAALEARARQLSAGVRCLVCQNQSIDDSNADLARDLRVLIRERLVAGDSDQQVQDFLVSRYGEYVLLKPRFSERNLVLWLLPVLLVAGAGGAMLVRSRRKLAAEPPKVLSAEEAQRLQKILDQ